MQRKHILVLVIITLFSILLPPQSVLAVSGWTLQTADATRAGDFTSIALDSNGYPHIAYCTLEPANALEYPHYLRYTRWNGTSWDAPTIVDSIGEDVGWCTSIAIDSNNRPHISYYDNTNTSLKYAYYDGTWHTETVDNSGECGVYGTSLALDNNNRPHISYMIRGSQVDLRYVKHNGTSWDTPITVDSVDRVGYYSSLALDSNDYPHISYIYQGISVDDDNGKLKYARWSGSTWDVQTLYDINTSALEWPAYNKHTSLALDASDYPHISYWKPSGLWYAKYDDSAWSEEKVAGSGKYNRLALDSFNYPHISYQSGDEKNLMYAYFNGTNWTTEVVDSGTGYTGNFSAIAVDQYAHPHISYQKSNDLKYARYYETPATVYVNGTTGNDSYNGSSPVYVSGNIGPKKTISGGIAVVDTNGTVNVAAGTYTESISTSKPITLEGAGAQSTIIDGGGISAFNTAVVIEGHPDTEATISGFTVQNGYQDAGGGIFINSLHTLYLYDCIVKDNVASTAGGIFNNGTLHMERCTISDNSAQYQGGGIYNNGQAWLTNCTISGNRGLEFDWSSGGGIYNKGAMTVLNCTIAYNSVEGVSVSVGGGFTDESPTTMTFKNTIVANNTAGNDSYNNGYFSVGNVTSLGNNIDSENSCGFDQPTDQINTDPLLGPLQNNGGQTSTHAITTNSPAFNNGSNEGAPANDQRGVTRPQGATCDIGAFELIYEVSTATGTGTTTFTTSAGALNSLTALASTPCGSLAGFSFPHGFFSFTISGLVPGSTITITITLPSNVPTNTQYWKCINGQWVNVTSLLGDNDGDNVLTLTIKDGGFGDIDGIANGIIVDPGGPAAPVPVTTTQTPKPFGDSSSYLPEKIVTSPARMSVKYLNVQPQQALANQPITIYASICNGGDEAGTYTATIKINGQVEEIRKGTVGSHNGIPLKLEVYRSDPGTYTVDINGQQSYFTVIEERSSKDSSRNNFRTLLIICIAGTIFFSTLLIYGLRIKH